MNHEHEKFPASSLSPAITHHDTVAPGRSSRSALLRKPDHAITSGLVQRKLRDANVGTVHANDAGEHLCEPSKIQIAERGTQGPAGLLPHLARIQASFGHHDVSSVRAHDGAHAADAAKALGARAYATVGSVVFASTPDLHTAAHEAAHVIQQRAGIRISGEIGGSNDVYERHADLVADTVVQGGSAESLLDEIPGAGGGGSDGVQLKPADATTASASSSSAERSAEDTGSSGWAGNLARAWDNDYRETTRILEAWVMDEPNQLKTATAATVQSMMDLGAVLVDVLKLGEGAAKGGWGWLDDILRVVQVVPALGRVKSIASAMRAWKYRPRGNLGKLIERNGLLSELRRLFYDNVGKWARTRYWKIGESAQGRHLHHWLFPNRWKWVPNGLRQAGFNLMEVSGRLNLRMTGSLMELKEWALRIGVLVILTAEEWLVIAHTRRTVEEHREESTQGQDRKHDQK